MDGFEVGRRFVARRVAKHRRCGACGSLHGDRFGKHFQQSMVTTSVPDCSTISWLANMINAFAMLREQLVRPKPARGGLVRLAG